MKLHRVIRKALRGDGVAGSVNAVVAANVNEPGPSTTSVSSRQTVVQRGGRPAAGGRGDKPTEGEKR